MQEVFKAYLPFDSIITFYERNTGLLSENQQKILMLHELRHITLGEKGLKIRPHDIEDFKDILETYGLDWNEPGKDLPDICKIAKVDRATYYRAFAKPEFVEIYNKRSMDLVKQ
ncbi:hypothetical protein M3661_15990 [Paenibacillus sp. MER 180]|nr:hypothetical protein [Paenibacillus sp. MER 180]